MALYRESLRQARLKPEPTPRDIENLSAAIAEKMVVVMVGTLPRFIPIGSPWKRDSNDLILLHKSSNDPIHSR
jgi:hypothetical protein